MKNNCGALTNKSFELSIEDYLEEKSQTIEIWICLANGRNPMRTNLKEVESMISYRKLRQAIDSQIIEYEIKLENTTCRYYLKPRVFIKFRLDNGIEVDSSLLDYFDYSYWAEKDIWTFDEAVTLLTLPHCPFSHEIIIDSMDKEETHELAQKLWNAIVTGKLGHYPSLPIEPDDGSLQVLDNYRTISLSPIKIFKWYAQEIDKDPIIIQCIESVLKTPLKGADISNCNLYKHELFFKVIIRFIFKELTLKHSTDPSFYDQEILSLHEAIRLILDINPKFYKVPDYMHDKFDLIIKEIKKAYLCNKLSLRFEGDKLPADHNDIFVGMCEFKTWIAKNKELSSITDVEVFFKKYHNLSDITHQKPDKLIEDTDKKARTRLNVEIENIIFLEQGKADAGKVWTKLKKKAETEETFFQIIDNAESKKIKWSTINGEPKSMSWATFVKSVSNIKSQFKHK